MDLLFLRFYEEEIDWEGKKTNQLFLTVVGSRTLGDGYGGEIKVLGNKVIISTSENQDEDGVMQEDVEIVP